MPGIAPAAAQPASPDPRPPDAAFKRGAFEIREACASNSEKIPIAPHPTNGDDALHQQAREREAVEGFAERSALVPQHADSHFLAERH
jgi:hypothetical protein